MGRPATRLSGAWRIGLLGLAAISVTWAQERTGEASVSFQQFYLANGSTRLANVSGLVLGYREFIPETGLFSVNLAPAASDGRFRTGESFIELKGLPRWRQYWTFRAGDFRMPGRVLAVPFNNLFTPEISGRGAAVEATHGGRTIGILFGEATLPAGMRVPLRLSAPQSMAGVYVRQQAGERLTVGARLIRLSTDLAELKKSAFLAPAAVSLKGATALSFDALYKVAGRLSWYGEFGPSWASREDVGQSARRGFSLMTGPVFESGRITLRANYVYQADSYLPLLGYYLGDRRGPFGEIAVRPWSWMQVYGSVSDYTNNVSRDPRVPTIHSSGKTAGVSLQLPARFSLSAQLSEIRLENRRTAADAWESSDNRQVQVTLSKTIRGHTLRIAARDFSQIGRFGLERQRALELEDGFQYKWFSAGGAFRAQRLIGQQSKTSVFVRGRGQVTLRRFSAYANVETGNDLANRTLFATTAVQSTVLGGSLRAGKDLDFSVEAYRNNLLTELNPQNVFVLQGQGVFVPGALAALNQWSVYIRMTKRLQWGKGIPAASNIAGFARLQAPLRGSVEGQVSARTANGLLEGVEGIPVALDQSVTTVTDAAGRYRFENVGEGTHRVGLAMNELPADFDPGEIAEATVLVRPGRLTRADLEVVPLGLVRGLVRAPAGSGVENTVLRLLPDGRYTTPDRSGAFSFYNLRAGTYEIRLDEASLPPHAVMTTPSGVTAAPGAGVAEVRVTFEYEVRPPAKPVRRVIPQSQPAPFALRSK